MIESAHNINRYCRAADHHAGIMLNSMLVEPTSGITVHWRALLRDGSNYVREGFSFKSTASIDLASISLVELDLNNGRVEGATSGSPIVAGNNFFAFEHPMADARVIDGHASAIGGSESRRLRSGRSRSGSIGQEILSAVP